MANNTTASANTAENKEENEKVNTTASANTKMVAIPIDPLNKKNNKVKVVINGHETEIIRGKQQKVSKEVYERLVIAGYVIEG